MARYFPAQAPFACGAFTTLTATIGVVYQSRDSLWKNRVKMNISSGLSQSQILKVNTNLRDCTYTSSCAMFLHFKAHPNMVSSEIMKILLTKKICMIHILFKNNLRHRGNNCVFYSPFCQCQKNEITAPKHRPIVLKGIII